jgi:hypothetical protein
MPSAGGRGLMASYSIYYTLLVKNGPESQRSYMSCLIRIRKMGRGGISVNYQQCIFYIYYNEDA